MERVLIKVWHKISIYNQTWHVSKKKHDFSELAVVLTYKIRTCINDLIN